MCLNTTVNILIKECARASYYTIISLISTKLLNGNTIYLEEYFVFTNQMDGSDKSKIDYI